MAPPPKYINLQMLVYSVLDRVAVVEETASACSPPPSLRRRASRSSSFDRDDIERKEQAMLLTALWFVVKPSRRAVSRGIEKAPHDGRCGKTRRVPAEVAGRGPRRQSKALQQWGHPTLRQESRASPRASRAGSAKGGKGGGEEGEEESERGKATDEDRTHSAN